MKVFLSWSGHRRKAVAEAFRDLLPLMLNAVVPWMSKYDLPPGRIWREELIKSLRNTKFAIACLTPENQRSDWLKFEAAAVLSQPNVPLVPYLLGSDDFDVS